ncbi:MAG: hypothetical protein K1X65_04030 [Caldilineales bacterium]|nr:hypothetical protein [Caldilineales bacterium]MCW5860454.1 hypothetical protein [Caldilineales bacterium]
MAERKETPDVLGEVLGSLTPPAEAAPPAAPVPPAAKRPRAAAKSKPAAAPTPPAAETEAQIALPPLFGGRQQWEYLHIVFRDYDGWRPYQQAGAKLANWKHGPDIDAYLATLGEQGWELAGAANGEHGQLDAFFKRRKS